MCDQDPLLRRKCIPFVFMTYPADAPHVDDAYPLTSQGFFEKKTTFDDWKAQLAAIIAYWTECHHPQRFISWSLIVSQLPAQAIPPVASIDQLAPTQPDDAGR